MSASDISFGFSVELVEASMANDVMQSYKDLKGQVDSLPAQFKKLAKQVLAKSHLKATGTTLEGTVAVPNSVLEELVPFVGMMGGGL